MCNLDRLKEITHMIEAMTEGRQRVIAEPFGNADILTENESHADLLLRKIVDYDTGDITLGFQASVRRMGRWMGTAEFQRVADEMQVMSILLYELDQSRITVTPEEMEQWSGWLYARQMDQAIEQAHEREPQLDCQTGPVPTMGML